MRHADEAAQKRQVSASLEQAQTQFPIQIIFCSAKCIQLTVILVVVAVAHPLQKARARVEAAVIVVAALVAVVDIAVAADTAVEAPQVEEVVLLVVEVVEVVI